MTEKNGSNEHQNGKKSPLSIINSLSTTLKALIGAAAIAVILAITVTMDYYSTIRVVSISQTSDLDARGGTITIKYSAQVMQPQYRSSDLPFRIRSELSKDLLSEIHTIIKPTEYKSSFKLVSNVEKSRYALLGMFLPPKVIPVTTGIEQVSLKGMIPAENTRPGPETLNNQLVLQFNGEVIGKYKQDINIPVTEMDFVKLTPELSGNYRWNSESTLTFNFTESKPGFEETYHFEVFPEKIINPQYQTWAGEKKEIEVTTSINEVYIEDFSLSNEVNWQDSLRIEFSGNMVNALDVLKNKSQDVMPVSITPKAGGVWIWSNARTLEFYPDDKTGWPVRQTVNVSILPEINTDTERKWRKGKQAEQYTFFVKPRKQSIRSYNLHGETVKLEEEMVIDFSRPMVEDYELRKKIPNNKLANNIPFTFTPHVEGEFYWSKPDRLKFRPVNLWSELTEYTVNLNSDYNPDKRYEWTGTNEFKFKTVENIVVAKFHLVPEIAPTSSQFYTNQGRYRNIKVVAPEKRLWILFDSDIGMHIKPETDMKKAVTIEPAVAGNYIWLSNSLLEFVPEDNWPESTEFTLKLTRKLLHHPQQHFVKDQDIYTFKTTENRVKLAQLVKIDESAPQVTTHYPEKPLELNFSKNVKALPKVGKTYWSKEIEASFLPVQISPEIEFSFKWHDQRKLVITPAKYWKPETQYKIALNKNILPQKQSQFNNSDFFYLKTHKNFVKINKISPLGRVDRRIILDVEFSRDIRPGDSKLGSADKKGLFEISPRLTGNWIWLADNKIQFKPNDALQASTSYKVLFDPNKISDKQFSWHITPPKDSKVYEKADYNIYTPALHVQKSKARFDFDKNNLLKQRFYLDMELSTDVNADDLRKHFSIWYKTKKDGESIQVPLIYKLETEEGKKSKVVRKFSVASDWIDRPASDRRIYYKITQGIMPVKGNLGLESAYMSDFLQEKPKNIIQRGVNWQWKDGFYKAIFSVNAPVEPNVLKKYLKVKQNTKILNYELSVNSSQRSGNYSYEISAKFKPGIIYEFDLAEGMLAVDGAFSAKDTTSKHETPNLPRKLKFALEGNILSQKDLNKVPLLVTNISQKGVYITIDQIYANNVNHFINHSSTSSNISQIAKRVHSKHYPIDEITGEYTHNEEVISHIDMSTLFRKNKHGLYRISVGENQYGHNDQRWFLSTDIGLIARRFNNHILVWANSLHSNESISGVDVLIYDKWNQVIGKGRTNSDGFVKLTYPMDGSPTHVVAKKYEDFSFIDLARHKDKLTGFNVEGISSKKSSIRSFIYSDRGVYRPGDTVHLVSVTRGKDGVLPEQYPVKFRLLNPSGKEILSERFKLDEHGVYVYDYQVPAEAKTGKWNASVLWDNKQTGNYTFQVEEFIPNKIKVELELINKRIYAGDTLKLKVKANNLFGPPASGRKVTGAIKLLPSYFKPKGYSGFTFGHDDNKFQRIDYDLTESRLDENGFHVYEYKVPENIDSPIGINASYSATVIDDGGRGVTNYGKTDVLLFSQYVGIKRLSDRVIDKNTPVGFEIVNVDVDGAVIPKVQQQLVTRIYRNKSVTHYRKNERGYYRYVTEKQRILVEELNDPRDQQGKFSYKPRYAGEHILEVEDSIGKQITRYRFYVAGEQSGPATQAADSVKLKVLTRKPMVNGNIKLEIESPFAGKLLLIGEREDVIFSRILQVNKQKKVINIEIEKDYLPNFYISAFVIKPVQQGSRQDPVYATGLINVNVQDPEQTPDMKLVMPTQTSPNGEFSIDINIDDVNNEDMFFTVAAVDVGILDLTKYKTPKMDGFFNQKRRLEVQHLNMYPLVMPYAPDYKHIIDPSGGAPSRSLIKKKRVNPDSQQRVKSMALWSGLQKLDKKGNATIKFKIPDFEGQMRVMVVAYGNQRFVSKQQNVVIRDKLVMKPTLPRFLATGDNFSIPVKLFNSTGIEGNVQVNLQVSDHIKLQGSASKTIYLSRDGEAELSFSAIVANELGVSEVNLSVEGVGETTRKQIKIPVRSPGSSITLGGNGDIDEATPRTIKMPGGFIEGSQQYAMKITSDRLAKFQGSLNYLLRYPHGCLEQTTSKVFPLLYYSDLAESSGDHFAAEKTPRYFVREGIKKIERMQLEDGRFSYWEGSNVVNNWSFMYSSHFLVEAQKAGYKIDEAVWNNMLFQLKESTSREMNRSNLNDRHYGVTHLLYGLYVLALADENVVSKLNYIHDNYLDELKLHDKARLGAAFAASGDADTAKRIIQKISNISEYDNPYRDTGGSFASSVRDLSMVLDGLVMVDQKSTQIPIIIDKLAEKNSNGHWGTTQENAFAFLAIGRAMANTEALKLDAKIILGDGTTMALNKGVLLGTPELLKGDVRIEVKGKGEVGYLWEAIGIEKDPKSLQRDEGVKIRRQYLDKNGDPLDLNNVRQGDMVVVELRMESLGNTLDNMVITDLLPMGLEIENARLSTSASLPWIKQSIQPDYVDIRDDRINIFLSIRPEERRYYFTTRAVTVGSFAVPPVRVEAMYNPDIFSEANRSKMRIQPLE